MSIKSARSGGKQSNHSSKSIKTKGLSNTIIGTNIVKNQSRFEKNNIERRDASSPRPINGNNINPLNN